jgi:hypothetical protein
METEHLRITCCTLDDIMHLLAKPLVPHSQGQNFPAAGRFQVVHAAVNNTRQGLGRATVATEYNSPHPGHHTAVSGGVVEHATSVALLLL